jgi:HPt (histidine-containing phosphotransfer) domain-containing protein
MLNLTKIEEIKELDDDGSDAVLKKLIALFLDSTPPKLRKMQDGFVARDFDTVHKVAHSLRSSALTLGADALAQFAFTVEYGKEEISVTQEGISGATQEFELLKEELKKYM